MQPASLHSDIYDPGETLASGFLHSADLYPEHPALWINEQQYTYSELLEIVRTIYNTIPPGTVYSRVAVYCNDDVETYASILAVNLYGAAWIPLNNKFPVARNRKIIEQCCPGLILSSSEKAAAVSGAVPVIITKDLPSGHEADLITKNHHAPAYILFTSGSTGEPKGVPVTRENVRHFFRWYLSKYDFSPSDRFLQVYELTFDVSVFSFFMPLLTGGCCYVVPGSGIRFVNILKMLSEHRITVLSMVPVILNYADKYLAEMIFPFLRYSFFSGDALYHSHALKWKQALLNGVIHNFYGPTETTIVCSRYVWNEHSGNESQNGIVPLGKLFEGMEMLILDEQLQPAAKGELCLSGAQVIPAYLDNASESSFFLYDNKRYYRTGDLASLNERGELLFHGRADQQVKISGYRIELEEVEAEIRKLHQGNVAVVSMQAGKGISGMIVFLEGTDINITLLKDKLSGVLPDYMIPARWIAVPEFRLNHNGKVSKKELLDTLI